MRTVKDAGPYGCLTGALFSRPFALKARGKGDHRRWWKGHLTSLVKDKERKNSHTLPALASPTPPSLSPREGSVRRKNGTSDRRGHADDRWSPLHLSAAGTVLRSNGRIGPLVQRGLCPKGGGGLYRQAGGTIPPSPTVPPPFAQGRLIAPMHPPLLS